MPKVNPDDTLIEIASMMDENHTPLIVVMAQESGYLGVVTMTRVLAAIARAAGEDSDLVRRRLDRDIIDRGTSGFLSGRDDSAGDDEANGAGSPEAHTS
ncbi:MAG: CBS domain-containing protein [Actinobacteria bacterium]|nr:CBS domain-containing protein [Actinomycetota bacterium]